MKQAFVFAAFLLLFLISPGIAAAQQCNLDVGPEIPDPIAGKNVIDAKGFTGAVSVINNITDVPFNPIPKKNNSPTVIRLLIDSGTTRGVAEKYATLLNSSGEFPNGVKAVVLGVELNNLDHEWGDTSVSLYEAGNKYATDIFIPFSKAISNHAKYPVSPAPPDMYNADYDPIPWLEGFMEGMSGSCGLIDVLTADVFDVPPAASVGGAPLETYKVLESYIRSRCGTLKSVVHFEGWGAWPGSSVADQVKFYETHTPPVTASTLIAPNCGSKKADGNEWWYYICGKVYKADGSEVDPLNCGTTASFADICEYNKGNKKSEPEFHSLRPYPSCPYEPIISNVSYYLCGNDLIANEKFQVPYQGGACLSNTDGSVTCEYSLSGRSIPVSVDLSKTLFPIVGLTEGPYVNNSESRPFGTLTDAQKVNEYLSWYLNGTTYRAEGNLLKFLPGYPANREQFPEAYEDTRKLIDYSGPLKKLLPLSVQTDKRVEQIERAEGSSDGSVTGTEARHDQIAACYYELNKPTGILGLLGGAASWLTDILEFDEIANWAGFEDVAKSLGHGTVVNTLEKIPGPCYPEKDSDGNMHIEVPLVELPSILPDITTSLNIKPVRLTDWKDENKIPPVYNPDTESFSDYWKKYKSWRGEFCSPTVLGFYLCFDDPGDLLKPNFWGTLFSYIPFSSTEDRIGYAEGSLNATAQPGGGVSIKEIEFVPEGGGDGIQKFLYFPHMQEAKELGALMQGMYVPEGRDGAAGGKAQGIYNTNRCEPVEARGQGWPGDRLHGDKTMAGDMITISGNINYSGTYKCTFKQDPVTGEWSTCDVTASTALSIYSAVPEVEDLWARYVNGPWSAFKRFYPKVGPDTPVTEIKDIPAEGDIRLTSSGASGETWAGDPARQRSGENAKIYFPHIGSVYDYFLKGIQKALRPLGAGSPVTTIGQNPDGRSKADLKACYNDTKYQNYVADTNLSVLNPSLSMALARAANSYNLPACVLEAILTTEGSQMRAVTAEQAKVLTSEWQYDDPMEVFTEQFGLSNEEAQLLYTRAYCSSNEAGAAGPMQLVDSAWHYHGGASVEKGVFSPTHHANRCNFVDAVFADAALLDAKLRSKAPWSSPLGYNWQSPLDKVNPEPYCYLGEGQYGSCRMDSATCRLGTNYCDYIRRFCGVPGDCSDYRETQP